MSDAPGVFYESIDDVDGKFFMCPKYRAKLSQKTCAAMYREGRRNARHPDNRRAECVGCPIGARHADDQGAQPVVVKLPVGRHQCVRCHGYAARLVQGGLCISCYNREREVRSGSNALGNAPHAADRFWGNPVRTKTLVLHEVTFAMDGAVQRQTVADTLEALLRVLRRERRQVRFSRPRTSPFVPQLTLFGGV